MVKHRETVRVGKGYTTEYVAWRNLRSRCLNINNLQYSHYGGRGIVVCDRWLGEEGFANFLQDMGRKPGPKYSIDRIDNSGPYSPDNCRWATQVQQARNRRSNVRLTVAGKDDILAVHAEQHQIRYGAFWHRLGILNWNAEDALHKPLRSSVKLEPGTRFNSWVVVSQYEGTFYNCRCDCGNECLVAKHDLQAGKSKRCRPCSARLSNASRKRG